MSGLNPDELINSLPDSVDCMYCEGLIKILGKFGFASLGADPTI